MTETYQYKYGCGHPTADNEQMGTNCTITHENWKGTPYFNLCPDCITVLSQFVGQLTDGHYGSKPTMSSQKIDDYRRKGLADNSLEYTFGCLDAFPVMLDALKESRLLLNAWVIEFTTNDETAAIRVKVIDAIKQANKVESLK